MNRPILLIDADPLKYATGFAIEHAKKEDEVAWVEPVYHAYYNVNSMIKKIMNRCESDHIELWLTKLNDKTNFRSLLFPEYKANRILRCNKCVSPGALYKIEPGLFYRCDNCLNTLRNNSPLHKEDIHNYILTRYAAKEAVGEEADDIVSIRHCEMHPFGFREEECNSIICSIDKDFNNVPGWHYNPIKDVTYFVSEIDALRNFYLQILTGDVADNVPRVRKGWIKTKVKKLIDGASTEGELFDIIYNEALICFDKDKEAYCASTAKESRMTEVDWATTREYLAAQFIERNGKLVWLRRKPGEMWDVDKKTFG